MACKYWRKVGEARDAILREDIKKATEIYKELFDKNSKDQAIGPIKKELLWMRENGMEGVGRIVKALGVDRICVEEFEGIAGDVLAVNSAVDKSI